MPFGPTVRVYLCPAVVSVGDGPWQPPLSGPAPAAAEVFAKPQTLRRLLPLLGPRPHIWPSQALPAAVLGKWGRCRNGPCGRAAAHCGPHCKLAIAIWGRTWCPGKAPAVKRGRERRRAPPNRTPCTHVWALALVPLRPTVCPLQVGLIWGPPGPWVACRRPEGCCPWQKGSRETHWGGQPLWPWPSVAPSPTVPPGGRSVEAPASQ